MQLKHTARWKKRAIVFCVDTLLTGNAWILACVLTSNSPDILCCMIFTLLQCLMHINCGLYRGVWRFASIPDLIRIIRSVFIGTLLALLTAQLADVMLPLKTFFIYSCLLIVMLSSPRLLFRWLRDYRPPLTRGTRVLVVGAGSAGEGVVRDLCRLPNHYHPVGFVDDDPARLGSEIHGIRVLGNCTAIPNLAAKHHIELIFIAIPSAGSNRMREIVHYCEETKLPIRTLPGLKDIADGSVTINSLREVMLEDLLGREQVALEWNAIRASIHNKNILVTGGGGSIGSELCRQIAKLKPATLIVIDNNEFNLYTIDMELSTNNPQLNLHSQLCSVTDRIEIEKFFRIHNPELVFHVAAYKHVPLLENHLRVSMYNNIIGTQIVAELADQYDAKSFIFISTDKAVNPSNVMGATKRAAEMYCQNLNRYSQTRFITVRFGNVLGSNGSVVPLFRKQIAEGGPITITHKDITRYFMTIPEATQLILQATTMEEQGEIFVLDMGEPIPIRYLAEQMIKLSGKTVNDDIKIKYIGLRPGEKLYEELFHAMEEITDTKHPKIKQAKVRFVEWQALKDHFTNIELSCMANNEVKLKELLLTIVPEFLCKNDNDSELESNMLANMNG